MDHQAGVVQTLSNPQWWIRILKMFCEPAGSLSYGMFGYFSHILIPKPKSLHGIGCFFSSGQIGTPRAIPVLRAKNPVQRLFYKSACKFGTGNDGVRSRIIRRRMPFIHPERIGSLCFVQKANHFLHRRIFLVQSSLSQRAEYMNVCTDGWIRLQVETAEVVLFLVY